MGPKLPFSRIPGIGSADDLQDRKLHSHFRKCSRLFQKSAKSIIGNREQRSDLSTLLIWLLWTPLILYVERSIFFPFMRWCSAWLTSRAMSAWGRSIFSFPLISETTDHAQILTRRFKHFLLLPPFFLALDELFLVSYLLPCFLLRSNFLSINSGIVHSAAM